MTDDLSFTDPRAIAHDGFDLRLLPLNYVEVALPDLTGQGTGGSRIVMSLPGTDLPPRYASIGAETLSDPEATLAYIRDLDWPTPDPDDPERGGQVVLGPKTERKPRDMHAEFQIETVTAEPWAAIADESVASVVVIIDAGIAFWNQRFRGSASPRFRGVRYLDYDGKNLGQLKELDQAGIEAYCKLADDEGNAAVVEALGAQFPHSVFGPSANPYPDGLWHGTAIADMAAGAETGTADNVALFGLELPRAVIADYSGGILTTTVAMIVGIAIEMTKPFAAKALTIVMPLGFPAGPQDGSHPAARAIAAALPKSGRKNVTLVLPAGNQLQDRCHARLNGDSPAKEVGWDLPPDDYSTNVVHMVGPSASIIPLTVAPPGQAAPATARMPESSFCLILREGERIGVLLRGTDQGGRYLMGLGLWQTAVDASRNGVPFGRWTLATNVEMQLWLARDDRDPVADRGRPRRPSYFWDPTYTRLGPTGAPLLEDDPGSAIRRTGTLSALATTLAADPGGPVHVVRASERLGTAVPAPAGYSSRREDGQPVPHAALVDDGRPDRGTMAAANGGARRMRVSGTSAAAGLHLRSLVLPTVPLPDP